MDWEQSYLEKNTPWDLGEPAPPLISLLENDDRSLFASSTVLVPGCGYGHDAEAWRRFGLEVTGLDVSPTALKSARNVRAQIPWQKTACQLEIEILRRSRQPEEAEDVLWDCLGYFPTKMLR